MVIRIEFRIGDAMGRQGIAATPRLEHIMVINGLPTHFPYVIDMQYMVVRITVSLGTAEIPRAVACRLVIDYRFVEFFQQTADFFRGDFPMFTMSTCVRGKIIQHTVFPIFP